MPIIIFTALASTKAYNFFMVRKEGIKVESPKQSLRARYNEEGPSNLEGRMFMLLDKVKKLKQLREIDRNEINNLEKLTEMDKREFNNWHEETMSYNKRFTTKEVCVLSLHLPIEVEVNRFIRVTISTQRNDALKELRVSSNTKQKNSTINYMDIFKLPPSRMRSSPLQIGQDMRPSLQFKLF